MQTHTRGNLNKIISFILMILILFSLVACGGEKVDNPAPEAPSKPPVTKNPDKDDSPPLPSQNDPDIKDEADAMFKIVLGAPSGMGEPATVLNGYFPEEGEPNYSFSLIPLRDGIKIDIETIYRHDLHFSELPYTSMDEVTGKLGEYYLVNAFVKQQDWYMCVRIVAQDGDEQASFLVDPVEHGESGEFTLFPGKIPDGLNDSKMQLLSGLAAGAVWRHGVELSWVEYLGTSSELITPRQLALSQAAYEDTLRYIIEINDYGYLEEPYYSAKAEQYAAALFPGVRVNALPESDSLTDRYDWLFSWADETRILLTAASADGKTGYVIVSIEHENENGWFENIYRVDWEADEPFDIYLPFQYRLVGVQPLERYLLGLSMHDHYFSNYLGDEAVETLKKLGITSAPYYIDTPGIWGVGDIMLFKTVCTDDSVVYVLLEEDGDRIIYLGAAAPPNDPEPTVEEGWSNLGIVTIPSHWTYSIQIHDDLVIDGEGPSGSFMMWAGYLMGDSVEAEVESSLYSEPFEFDDGHIGYMLYFDNVISWLREDGMTLHLYDFYDESVYENNTELVLKIARSLTAE